MVEVAPGRFLFALLKGAGTTEYMGSVVAASIAGREGRVIDGALFAEVKGRRGWAAGVIAVAEGQYLVLVTFDAIARPETVREVDPAELAAVFGAGVRLKAGTEGRVEGGLGWMPKYPEAAIIRDFDPMDFSLSATLREGDFIRTSR